MAAAGWSTLSSLVAIKEDDALDLSGLERLLKRVCETIHQERNNVRYAMNGFVIAVGTYVAALSDLAEQAAVKIGVVSVDMGNTACEVPARSSVSGRPERAGRSAKNAKR